MSALLAQSLFSLLSSDPTVAGFVQSRIFPLVIPLEVFDGASTKPCIVYQQVTADRQQKFCGTDTLITASFDLHAYARGYDQARELADAVITALNDYRGAVIKHIFLESEIDLHDIDPGLYRVTMVFTIWYRG